MGNVLQRRIQLKRGYSFWSEGMRRPLTEMLYRSSAAFDSKIDRNPSEVNAIAVGTRLSKRHLVAVEHVRQFGEIGIFIGHLILRNIILTYENMTRIDNDARYCSNVLFMMHILSIASSHDVSKLLPYWLPEEFRLLYTV